jgi:NitT/TauT family transport system substrate-binding protein
MSIFARVKSTATVVMAVTMISAFLVGDLPAFSQEAPKKVRLGVATAVLNAALPYAMMPGPLGYWKEEGYDVEVFAAGSAVQAVQLINAGQVDFIQVNTAPMMQAVVKNKLPLRAVMATTVIDWRLVSQADGPIKSLQDFKGKTIGVPAPGPQPFLESFLTSSGMDPKKDVQLVSLGGAGPAALAALSSGHVQGLMFWGSAIAGFEAAGAKFNYFFDPAWRKNTDFMLVTRQSTIVEDPKMVEGIARGEAKASLFSITNPDCMRRIHWARYPDQKPSGAVESEVIAREMIRINASLTAMKSALENGKGKWGATTPEDFKRLEDIFVAGKILEGRLDNAADYIVNIPDFYDKVNAFDQDAVKRRAMECQIAP